MKTMMINMKIVTMIRIVAIRQAPIMRNKKIWAIIAKEDIIRLKLVTLIIIDIMYYAKLVGVILALYGSVGI